MPHTCHLHPVLCEVSVFCDDRGGEIVAASKEQLRRAQVEAGGRNPICGGAYCPPVMHLPDSG